MGNSGKPVDETGANTANKTNDPPETPTRTDKAVTPAETNNGGDSGLTPIAQIAVDNQVGTLPGSTAGEKPAVAGGKLEITPVAVGSEKTPEEKKPEPPTRSEELTQIPPALSYQDGRSDAIDLSVKRVMLLPKDDKARELVLRQLAETFENGKTYAERLKAAKALITLTRGSDGKVPDVVAQRDVLVPERSHEVPSGRSGRQKVVDEAAHHELRPLASAEVLKFINNSAETIEQQTKALKDKPREDKDRHNLEQKLTLIFQTYGDQSPEKLAAAKALLELNRKADGSYPDVVGSRTIEIPEEKRTRGSTTVVVKEARTVQQDTKASEVLSFLNQRSDSLIADTAKFAGSGKPASADGANYERADLSKRAVNTFLDSPNVEDKTAAAVALLELGRNADGSFADALGSRHIHKDAVYETPSRGTKRLKTPAQDYDENIKKTDAVDFLQKQLDASSPPRARIMAADALKSAGVLNEDRYKEVVKGILSDDTAPEALKVQLRKQSGVDQQQEGLKLQADGRVIGAKPEDYLKLDTKEGGERDRLQLVLQRLALNPDLKALVTDKQIETMNQELKNGTFGPASRDFYNKAANYMNDMTNGLAVAIVQRNGNLPEGLAIDVPKDPSGRAIGDDYFRAQLITGRLAQDIKQVKPGEVPEGDKLAQSALWNVKAVKEFDNMRLKWEVEVFDDRLQAFNKNGKLDAWKSREGMSIDEMRELQSARGEWLNLGMQVRNYAHAIHYFNKATTDASNIPRLSISRAEFSVFSDEALSDANFPGKVKRENGKIVSVDIDLPTTLDRHNPENLEKVAKLRAWLEKYGPKVDQVTKEITKASVDSGRLLMWGDVDQEGVDEVTGKPYNFTSLRFDSSVVKVKMPDGTEEERIKVVSSRQHRYAGNLSFYKTVGDIEDIGNPQTSGEITVNGKIISATAGDEGVSLGKNGDVKIAGDSVDEQHARMKVLDDGRVLIKDTGSKSGTYVNGERIESNKWIEVTPNQTVTLGKPPATLAIGKTESGEVTINGQTVKVGEPTKLGTSSGVKVEGEGVSGEHALVRVDADGKIYIKDNGSERGTYVNGKAVSGKEWTQISSNDKVTFGPPAAELDIQGDVRLYKPGDMVTVLLDGQMQLMPAENLKSWATEAETWHWTGKGAMAALDLGMLVSGGIALKGIQTAAMQGVKEAGKAGMKAVVAKMVTSPGFARGAWHVGLGLTGIAHQSIENTGPFGKKFMELRGYAMMADIFYGSFIKDGASVARKAFGMAKPAEEGSALAGYLESAPWAKAAQSMTDYMFLGMNGYFIPEIAAHQMPAIFSSIRKHDAASLLQAGALLRGSEYKRSGADQPAPPVTLEDQVRRFATPEGRDQITAAKKEANQKADLPDEKKKEKQAYLEQLTSKYLDAKTPDEKVAAAFGLLAFHAKAGKTIPDVLGTRWKTQNAVPDNVTSTEVKAFLDSRVPRSINMFDKELQSRVEANFSEVAKVADKPAGDAQRKQLNEQLIRQFSSAENENDRVAAAMGLMLLNEKGGKVPDTMGSIEGPNGKIEVKSQDVRELLSRYQSNALVARFDSYASTMKGNEKADAVLAKTRELLTGADNPEARKAETTRLQDVFEKSQDRNEKAAAAIGLLFLNTDKSTGAFPETLAQTKYTVDVQRFVSGGYGGYGYSAYGGAGRLATVKEERIRDLKTADVLQYLKGNMSSFPAGTRLAVGDALYRANEAPMAGGSPFNDYGGVLLSVIEDKNAPAEVRRQALANAHGLGLADVMEIHRFGTEPGISKLEKTQAAVTEADIYGRDSKAMEKALLDIVAQPDGDKDLRALASSTLLANSEPDPVKRKAMLAQMQKEYDTAKDTPGAYYKQVFERESNTLKSMFKDGEFQPAGDEDRARLFRSAVILSKTGNWKDFGLTDQQMALAMEASFVPQQPLVARHALDPLLKHYKDLDNDGRALVEMNMLSLIGDTQGGVNSPGHLLRLDVLNRIGEIESVLGPQFAEKARQTIAQVLTPGTVQYIGSDENIRAAAVRALKQIGSNDTATQDLLKRIVGAGDRNMADPSPVVRSAAIDRLGELHPTDLNQIATKLLERERDPEVLRKIGELARGTSRLDPDSAEYRERFRISLNRLMEAGANKYSLAEVPDFIRKNYPMLEWTHLYNTAVANEYKGEGDWTWTWDKQADLEKPYFDAAKKEMWQQLDTIIAKAASPEGDMERRTLTWIVMSNGRFFDESTKQEALQRASNGLFNAAKTGDAKTKEQLAPLLLMAVATQDRMPFATRSTLVSAIEELKPGQPGSPISRQDAGVALLAGLKRQFERTPRDGNDPGYQASHDLQMKLLDAYQKYMGTEAIPILEAMVADQTKFKVARDEAIRVKDVTYPDQSKRSVDYTKDNEVWRLTEATKTGAKVSLVRSGSSDEWYDEADPAKKTVWRGKVVVDQTTGKLQKVDSFGNSTTYTADGGIVEARAGQVSKVTYPDGSSREVANGREIITNAQGVKQVWVRQPNSNTWYQDTDVAKKSPWTGTSGFDAEGNYVQQKQGQPKEAYRPDGSKVTYQGDKPVFSTPSNGDFSAHPMPLVRDKAKQLLAQLRDGTDALRQGLTLDSFATPETLANNLRKVADKPDANSEEITRAILVAGLSKPLGGADDPRRPVLRELLDDPHERIRLAAAHMLFESTAGQTNADAEQNRQRVKQDRERAAGVIADMYKNGSRQGYREDALVLIDTVKKQSGDSPDAQMLDAAIQNVKAEPRLDRAINAEPRTVDQQEKYEEATGALIRDTQITLDALENPEWWSKHGYRLLESGGWKQGQNEASDGVSFNMWEKVVHIFNGDPAAKKFQAAFDNINRQRDEQFKALKDRAMSNEDSEEARDARKALAFIVLTNGYPLTADLRQNTVHEAAEVLAHIYRAGGPGADFAEQIIRETLIANPGINIDVRETFAYAVSSRLAQDASVKGNASNTKAALLLANALETEHFAMPVKGQPGYDRSIEFQNMLLNRLDRLHESIAMPVLEAMAKGHPVKGLKDHAARVFNRMKDGTTDILLSTVPDTTTPKAEKAKALSDLLSKKGSKNDEDLIREMMRLAHPRTFDKNDPKTLSDPRIEVLRKALSHENERVRLAAAGSLWAAGDPRGTIALSQLRDSARPGIATEAGDLYGAQFLVRSGKVDAEGQEFLRQSLNSENERSQIAAARMLLLDQPTSAAATEVLLKSYGSAKPELRAEAREVLSGMLRQPLSTPIEQADDPRRASLQKQLQSVNEQTQLAAAWMLSHSKVDGDFERAAEVLGKLAVKNDTESDARSLIRDFVAYGSDKQQAFVLAKWQDAWKRAGSDPSDKPPAPTDLDQARKYFRLASSEERNQIMRMPESDKKALILRMSGMSEQELEQRLQPAPTADVIAPVQARSFDDPFSLLQGRNDLLFPLPGTENWNGGLPKLTPLNARWQPGSVTRWSQPGSLSLPRMDGSPAQPYYRSATAGGTGSQKPIFNLSDPKTPFVRVDSDAAPSALGLNIDKSGRVDPKDRATLARLSMANMLQDESRTGAVISIGRDGKLALQPSGKAKPGQYTVPGNGDDLLFGTAGKAPPEFSEFLDYLQKQRPDVLQKETIRASELSVMFLQYLRQREAGLASGYMVTPSLFDKNVQVLTSDPRALPWYTQSGERNPRDWSQVQKERERLRAGKLDEELRKVLASDTPNGSGMHWKPEVASQVTKPEFLAKPPVEMLEVNRLGLTNILPAPLLGSGNDVLRLPGTADNTDAEIPTRLLNPGMWRPQESDERPLLVVRSPNNRPTLNPTSFRLSPESQELLRRYRLMLLQDQLANMNRTVEEK